MNRSRPHNPEGPRPLSPPHEREQNPAPAPPEGFSSFPDQSTKAVDSPKRRNKIVVGIKYILALLALLLGLAIMMVAVTNDSSSAPGSTEVYTLFGLAFLVPSAWFFCCEVIDKARLSKHHPRVKRFAWLPALISAAAIVGVMMIPMPASVEDDVLVTAGDENSASSRVVSNYSEEDYLLDTDVKVWSFDATGEERVSNGQQLCVDLARNGWVSSDPEAVTLAFSSMSLSYTVATILTDAPDLPEVEGLEKSRYLVKYATKAYCPELHRDEVPDLEDVLARNQQVDESVAKTRKLMTSQ